MKRFSEQFKKQANNISLKVSELADLRERVTAYMEYHPLPAHLRTEAIAKLRADGIVSQPFLAVPINWFFVRGSAAALALFMIILVPVAAEYTKPGDVLYPVKVRFNEEVRSSLTLNPYEKIEWETERLERRISEARLLASEGKLTDEVEAQVAEAVKEHSDNAKAQIAVLRETDQDEAAIAEIAFATALSVQSEVLDKAVAASYVDPKLLADGSTEVEGTGSVLASLVAEETVAAEASQAASVPSYGKLVARVEIETTTAFELFSSVKTQATPEQMLDIERRLSDIKQKVSLATAPRTTEMAELEVSDTAAAMITLASSSEVETEAEVSLMTTTATSSPAEAASSTEVVEEAVSVDEVLVVSEVVLTEAEAIEVLRGVMADLRKLITFMTDIDVRSSVSVDELVPITLTEEERLQTVRGNFEVMRNFTARVADEAFTGLGADKINLQIAEVVRLQAEAETALAVLSLELAETLTQNGVTLVEDIEDMILFFANGSTESGGTSEAVVE